MKKMQRENIDEIEEGSSQATFYITIDYDKLEIP